MRNYTQFFKRDEVMGETNNHLSPWCNLYESLEDITCIGCGTTIPTGSLHTIGYRAGENRKTHQANNHPYCQTCRPFTVKEKKAENRQPWHNDDAKRIECQRMRAKALSQAQEVQQSHV